MSLYSYFQRQDPGLPDPKGTLSSCLPRRAIAMANSEVEKTIHASKSKKRGSYHQYSPETRAAIGKFASLNGVSASSRHFSRQLKHHVSTSTVLSIKKSHLEEKKRRDRGHSHQAITMLPSKTRGRPLLLGDIDGKIQAYLKKTRESGGVIKSRMVMSVAQRLVLYYNPSLLRENGGHMELNRNWALSLLERMKYVKRKGSTARSKESVSDFMERKKSFLQDVIATVEMEEIPFELILNWDQTGIKIVPSSNWTMELQGSKRVEITGIADKRQITAVLCGNIVGDFLPVQLIYQGRSHRCHPHYEFPDDWHITHSPRHWSTETTMLQYIENIILPYVEGVRHRLGCGDSAALVIIDNFKGQITPAVNDLLESNNIHTCLLSPNTTDRLQPLDISVNKSVKDYLKRRFNDWYAQQVVQQISGKSDDELENFELPAIDLSMARMKEISAEWIVDMAEYINQNPTFLVNGFIKSGITEALTGISELSNTEEQCEADQGDDSTDDESVTEENVIIEL